MNSKDINYLIRSKTAADYLGITEYKLWQLTKDNKLPIIRMNRSVRYRIADLEAFLVATKGGAA